MDVLSKVVFVRSELNFYLSGFECEEHNNPADFFIDIISGSQQRTNNTNDELKCKDLAALEDGDVKKAINIADIVITKDGDTKDYENSLKPGNLTFFLLCKS